MPPMAMGILHTVEESHHDRGGITHAPCMKSNVAPMSAPEYMRKPGMMSALGLCPAASVCFPLVDGRVHIKLRVRSMKDLCGHEDRGLRTSLARD